MVEAAMVAAMAAARAAEQEVLDRVSIRSRHSRCQMRRRRFQNQVHRRRLSAHEHGGTYAQMAVMSEERHDKHGK